MSNTQVGVIYQQIIADVIESSRVDFEEGGVDDSVLEALRKGWQTKLTQLDVAAFPWDPKPEVVPPFSNAPPSVSTNGGSYQHINNQVAPQQPLQQVGLSSTNAPHIKTEPGTENSSINQYSSQISSLPHTATTAQQRAAAHLHNNYGPRAAASINAIQQGASHNQQGGPTFQQIQIMQQQQQLQLQQQQSAQQITQQEYQKKITPGDQNITNLQASRPTSDLGNAQTDGVGNDFSLRDTDGASRAIKIDKITLCRTEIDSLIRTKVKAMGTSIEGGGLMIPLRQLSNVARNPPQKKFSSSSIITAQMDGGEDDDDDIKYDGENLDEDAINSDLDDPDEGLNDDDDDEDGMGHIMLCMYDKVQRVKNKWKCVMKDGVLTVNNKEYVFHKASGEYEW
ncbi:Transcription initiation factor IIA large subunit [Erysiphe necator]|uniref:Transcription initiation factor IIA large subunit n=1 Tax=Uncinula necator TaxID=52586 RepID=A0A0B1PBQ0_UNCNE|nr:Transcription initiation factor IIA large subunit [Erysiphe necator]KHJ34755.1 putative transcription factor iia [Erysiphe necator]